MTTRDPQCMSAMPWASVELEPEVVEWLASLADGEFRHAGRYIDLLADEGVQLGEPFSRQLSEELRELRFYLGRRQVRITCSIATGRRIVLLTVLAEGRPRERREVQRAEEAMRRCIEQGHTAEEEQ